MNGSRSRVAVVGSGISGLAAAYRLHKAGDRVEVIERDAVVGGRFGIGQLGEHRVMLGGKNIGRNYTSFRRFVADLGDHEYEEFGINTSRVGGDRLRRFDSREVGTSLRNVFAMASGSPRDLGRLVALAARVRRLEANRFLGSPAFTKLAARFDGAPLSAHFSDEVTRNLLRPMTVRMNGAEPDEVYLGTLGTNLGLVLDTFDQLGDGIEPVLNELAGLIDMSTGCVAEQLVVEDGRVVGLRLAENGSTRLERYDAVVVATPAHAAAELLASTLPELSGELAGVRYFPTTVALVEYDRPVFPADVRALAMDDGPCSNAGAYGRGTRHVVRYTFSGRDARVEDPSADQIQRWLDDGEATLRHHVPSSQGADRVHTVTRHWPHGYCAYVPYHHEFLGAVRRGVDAIPGLALAGDYLLGVSLEACVRSGEAAAATIVRERAQVAA